MHIKLNQNVIIERCGNISFKTGESFYHANKVRFENDTPNRCEATVVGKSNFHVTIEKVESGGFHAECSCPKLASVKSDCQHIAAVLLAVYARQRKKATPIIQDKDRLSTTTNQALTADLLSLFNGETKRSSKKQLHFEDRELLDIAFICKPITMDKSRNMIGIEIRIGTTGIQNIRDFLEQVKRGNSYIISPTLTYDPNLYCFPNETDAVIQQLIQIIYDEKVYMDDLPNESDYTFRNHTLLIPPSSWERLVSLLQRAPLVKLAYGGNTFDNFHLLSDIPPLHFYLSETGDGNYGLKVKGLDQMIVLDAYCSVLSGGGLIQMEKEEGERLSELNQMLKASSSSHLLIPREQINDFLVKAVPGLKKLGDVQLSEAISKRFSKAPLVAKLYLDRVSNRLLAGLEFHYEGIVINPLEPGSKQGSMFVRDVEKEDAILQLMDDSLFAKTEGGYFVHNEALEYAFLYHIVPQLQKLLQIYATTAVRNRITKEKAHPRIRVKFKKERTNWLEFKFEMDGIPEKQIREILLALEEKRKYYRLANGSLLSLETKEFEEINRFLHAVPDQDEDLESGLNVPIVRGLQLLDTTDDNRVFKLEESFRQFTQGTMTTEFMVPESLETVLRDYQKHGYKWMKTLASFGFGGILADDMGLGKTLQSIAFILSELPAIRKRKQPALIVCPSSLTYNWLSEINKFTPEIKVAIVDGNKSKRATLQKDIMDQDVVITSYPLLRVDINWYEKQTFHTVFFDEAQAFKNPITQTARAVKKVQANYHFALTGTPIENSLEELWSIFRVVFPELFQGLKEFNNLTRKKIAGRIRPFLLRRMKADVLLELPKKVTSQKSSDLLPEQKKLYAAYLAKLRHDTLKHLDKDTLRKNRIKVLAGLTRLRQICCHPALFVDGYQGSSAKFEQLLQILEESRIAGRRVLIFSQFTKMLQLIGRDLAGQGLPYFYLDGHTPSEERVERCNRFNAGERDLFLVSLKAGGTGLNLTGADTVILYDLWWNPAVEEQAADRAHRIGQTNAVQVIKLVSRGTIEDKMNELQEKKRHLIAEVIDPKEKSPATLTEADIREILMI